MEYAIELLELALAENMKSLEILSRKYDRSHPEHKTLRLRVENLKRGIAHMRD